VLGLAGCDVIFGLSKNMRLPTKVSLRVIKGAADVDKTVRIDHNVGRGDSLFAHDVAIWVFVRKVVEAGELAVFDVADRNQKRSRAELIPFSLGITSPLLAAPMKGAQEASDFTLEDSRGVRAGLALRLTEFDIRTNPIKVSAEASEDGLKGRCDLMNVRVIREGSFDLDFVTTEALIKYPISRVAEADFRL